MLQHLFGVLLLVFWRRRWCIVFKACWWSIQRGHEAVGVLSKCLLGKEDAFLCRAFISTWKSGQEATGSWHLGGHSWESASGPWHHQNCPCWTLCMVQRRSLQVVDPKLSSPALPWIFANSHRDQRGLWWAKDIGAVPIELNVQKRRFMWLYVSFNFLVENAVNL